MNEQKEMEVFVETSYGDMVEQDHLRTDSPDFLFEKGCLMMERHQGGLQRHTPLDEAYLLSEIEEADNSSHSEKFAPGDGITVGTQKLGCVDGQFDKQEYKQLRV